MESVYLETSFISYLVSEPSRDLLVAAHQQTTHEWWMHRRDVFDCYVSQMVIDEIEAGDPEKAKKRIDIIRMFSVLEVTEEIESLTKIILSGGAIPERAVGDAVHIAVSAIHNMNYLLTWNCKHLANAQIIRKIAWLCNKEGYNMPVICTPEELMEEQ